MRLPILSYQNNTLLKLEEVNCSPETKLKLTELGIYPDTELAIKLRKADGSAVISVNRVKIAIDKVIAQSLIAVPA
jgi:Fe2+ transport system protein FeoA